MAAAVVLIIEIRPLQLQIIAYLHEISLVNAERLVQFEIKVTSWIFGNARCRQQYLSDLHESLSETGVRSFIFIFKD